MSCMKLIVLEKKYGQQLKLLKYTRWEKAWGKISGEGASVTVTDGFQGDMPRLVLWALKSKQTGQTNWIQLLLLQLEQKQLPERKGEAVVIQEVNWGGVPSLSRLAVRLPTAWRTRRWNGWRNENQSYCSGAMNYGATLNGSVVSQEN